MNIGWWIFTFLMGIPGGTELYAAYKLFPFIRKEGGLIPFMFCLLSGLFDLSFFLIMIAILTLGGELALELPLDNILVLLVVIVIVSLFIAFRFMSSVISLWFAGVVDEKVIRSFGKKKKSKRTKKAKKK